MALGDKKRVLMEADKAAAGGVATLDASGKLVQMPTAADVDAVALDGSNNMTGDRLGLKSGVGSVSATNTYTALSANPSANENNTTTLRVWSNADINSALNLRRYSNGVVLNNVTVLHSGNVGNYAAPAGFGLGGDATESGALADCNNATKNGWYYLASGTKNCPEKIYLSEYGGLFVCARGSVVHQFVYYNGGFATRNNSGGTFGEWEYFNPPMALGVEYRTTERYMGKPVYVMLVDFGTLPNASEKYVVYTTDTNVLPFFICGRTNETGVSLPGIDVTKRTTMINIYAGKNIIYAKTTEDYSARSATVLVKYTKSTD